MDYVRKKVEAWRQPLRTLVEVGILAAAIASGFMAYSELDARLDFALAIQTGSLKRAPGAEATCEAAQSAADVAAVDAAVPPAEKLEIDKFHAQTLLDDLVMRGVSCNNLGLDGVRKALGLPRSSEKQGASWDMTSPFDGARWAFSRTRSTLLFVYVVFLFSLVGTALPRSRSKSEPLLPLRPVVEGAILALVLLIVALGAPKLLYATEVGRSLWLRPSAALLLGFFAGAFRSSALVMVRAGATRVARQVVDQPADKKDD